MNMTDFSQEVHQNAVEHGWWDEERSFGEVIALCHSELSEALEEYRAGRPVVWQSCQARPIPCARESCGDWCDGVCEVNALDDKPEGIAVELADCIIRVLDWFGKEKLDAGALVAEAKKAVMCDVPGRIYASTLGDCISRWHLLLSLAYSCWCRASGQYAAALRMALCVAEIEAWAAREGVDLEAILEQKHAYNKTRPYRHGGKIL